MFAIAILVYSGLNLHIVGRKLGKEVRQMFKNQTIDTSSLEEVMLENIPGKISLVETYGLIQKVLQKKDYNNFEYVKDNDGYLNYASFYREDTINVFTCAERVKKLKDYIEPYGTKLIFVIAPSKFNKDSKNRSDMPISDPTQNIIELEVYLRRLGVDVINLSSEFPNSELTYDESFFKTDHHWTIPAAFMATGMLVEEIKKTGGPDLDPTGYYTNPDAYDSKTYYGNMLGAMGRDTGIIYSGLEDFTAYFPKYDSNFTRTYMERDGDKIVNTGSFENVLMDKEVLQDKIDYYTDSQYSLYMDQVRDIDLIINNDNPDGPSIGMIRDSYFAPVIAFMAPMCSRIDALYSLEKIDDLDITSYIKEQYRTGKGYDYFIVEYYPFNIEEASFRFFRGDN